MSGLHLYDFSSSIIQLPRLDKMEFIRAYIKEQKVNAKAYALEGRALVSSWSHAFSEAQSSQINKSPRATRIHIEYGFGTPVLKPRAIGHNTRHSDIAKPRASNDPAVQNGTDKALIQIKENKRKRDSDAITGKVSISRSRRDARSKRHAHVHATDSEQYNRLKERRERRRVKHAIIKSIKSDSELGPQRTKRENKRIEVPAGFALMHGFSAKNLGSGRLTMKHPQVVGVFNKGKASTKKHVDLRKSSREKNRHNRSFSETAFLIGSERKSRQSTASLSLSAPNTDHSTQDRDPNNPLNVGKNFAEFYHEGGFGVSNMMILGQSHIVKESTKPLPNVASRAESITWDIELTDAPLPSQTPSGGASIIFDTRQCSWAVQKNGKCIASGCTNPEYAVMTRSREELGADSGRNDQQVRFSPSIGPSQSASQYAHSERVGSRPPIPALSKYFVNDHQPHLPTNDKLEVDTSSQLETDYSSSAILFCNTSPIAEEIADRPHQKPTPPSPISSSFRSNEEVGVTYSLDLEIGADKHYLVHEGSGAGALGSIPWEHMDEHEQFQPPENERNFINEDDEIFKINPRFFNCTQSDLDCTLSEDIVHNAADLGFFGLRSGIREFGCEVTEKTHHYDKGFGYSRSDSEGSRCDQVDQPYDERWWTAIDNESECFSTGFGMREEACDHGHSLTCTTSHFLQGPKLLLDCLKEDPVETPHSQASNQVEGYRPVALVEADVAKSLRNHWVPHRLY